MIFYEKIIIFYENILTANKKKNQPLHIDSIEERMCELLLVNKYEKKEFKYIFLSQCLFWVSLTTFSWYLMINQSAVFNILHLVFLFSKLFLAMCCHEYK